MYQQKELIWRVIPNTKGYYEVSNTGEVRSIERVLYKSNGRTETRVGHVLKQSTDTNGYKVVSICISGYEQSKKVHRLVAETFIDNPILKKSVNHKDGNKGNNHAENLEWVTSKENTAHAVKTGLFATGERHPKARSVICVKTGERYGTIRQASKVIGVKETTLKSDILFRRHKYIVPESTYTINMEQYAGEAETDR